MAAKFSSVLFGVLVVVAIVALLFSSAEAGGPYYGYCLQKCIGRCDEFCKTMEYSHGGDCNSGPCCCWA
ncbi:hypothetical protein E2562_028107 [Oryza meyeriana var. granulata]|uniref:Knottin scorpion toxin-like domain-containing protein n=1 Tax=Oryza meyeriana var. granulata TaxID=110450 RepID=A0A6G1C9G7_9ORYZ|nr:hypothetical protein E2562_028107 [Oryza meyeriana var. granulata]